MFSPVLWRRLSPCGAAAVVLLVSAAGRADDPAGDPLRGYPAAEVRVRAGEPAGQAIPKYITGKFCEHLGDNVYHGMDAQVLRNPTFGDFPFWTGEMTPEGLTAFHTERDQIVRLLRERARRYGWPDAALDRLVEAREDALATWWVREGPRSSVQVSPDTGPSGGRAQRVQVHAAGEGIAQWSYLPLHRVRRFELEILARSRDVESLTISLMPDGAERPCATAAVRGLSRTWGTFRGTLDVDARQPADAPYRLALTADAAGQIVVARVLLRPADHVDGADPDVVRLLRESRLPILRWPGGNFASTYHWADGVGPTDRRPTRANFAWGGVEPNLFGTGEFLAFCRAVGSEPMICVNAGDGTAAEAARWVEYCNGAADSPMGRLRAANGHPEPYRVRHWEVGNELWGKWQNRWTTAAGYVDRFDQFRTAMLAADPAIQLYACGAPVLSEREWNRTLVRGAGAAVGTMTDHPLIGGSVPTATDPMDVYRDFMAVPDVLAGKWQDLRRDMLAAGIRDPRLAVTELQLYAKLAPSRGGGPARLRRDNLVTPTTLAEALYDVLIYHRAVRFDPFVSLVTHSATVNHGGGLRKERERVYPNPCHHAQAGFAAFQGARPVPVEVTAPVEAAPLVLPDLKAATSGCRYEALDALAARTGDGGLLLSLVHRGSSGPLRVAVRINDFAAGPRAAVRVLSADVPWAANTRAAPEAVRPREQTAEVRDGRLSLELAPYSWALVRIPPPRAGELPR